MQPVIDTVMFATAGFVFALVAAFAAFYGVQWLGMSNDVAAGIFAGWQANTVFFFVFRLRNR